MSSLNSYVITIPLQDESEHTLTDRNLHRLQQIEEDYERRLRELQAREDTITVKERDLERREKRLYYREELERNLSGSGRPKSGNAKGNDEQGRRKHGKRSAQQARCKRGQYSNRQARTSRARNQLLAVFELLNDASRFHDYDSDPDTASVASTASTMSNLSGAGRALGNFYSYAGRILEIAIGKLAHRCGFGPFAVGIRLSQMLFNVMHYKYHREWFMDSKCSFRGSSRTHGKVGSVEISSKRPMTGPESFYAWGGRLLEKFAYRFFGPFAYGIRLSHTLREVPRSMSARKTLQPLADSDDLLPLKKLVNEEFMAIAQCLQVMLRYMREGTPHTQEIAMDIMADIRQVWGVVTETDLYKLLQIRILVNHFTNEATGIATKGIGGHLMEELSKSSLSMLRKLERGFDRNKEWESFTRYTGLLYVQDCSRTGQVVPQSSKSIFENVCKCWINEKVLEISEGSHFLGNGGEIGGWRSSMALAFHLFKETKLLEIQPVSCSMKR